MADTLRIAIAQLNPTVGDLDGNVAKALAMVKQAEAADADLVLLPEMTITGYPPEDLVFKPGFIGDVRASLDKFAAGTGRCVAVVGFADGPSDGETDGVWNAAAVCAGGKIHGTYHKRHLPNYDVFDEIRHFRPGDGPFELFEIAGVPVGVTICEDSWIPDGPVNQLADGGARIVVNVNGSPFRVGKQRIREDVMAQRVEETGIPVVYANLVGGQDELVFDGDSLVVDAAGHLLQRACQFDCQIVFADLTATRVTPSSRDDVPVSLPVSLPVSIPASNTSARERQPLTPTNTPRLDDSAELYAALRLGLADYVNKNGFTSVLLGLSGGIDSAFVGALAVDALGADRVFGVAMPSRYSSTHSVQDAHDLAERTGLTLCEVPIGPMFDAFQSSLHLTGLAEENLQARIRGMVLMSLSNAEGHLVLATGNKSELSVGYSTIYGDAVGGFAPIKDVPKTLVWELARWRNEQAESAGSTGLIPPR
ncbi:MAG TPA: NAD+ synthase, partial [Acidimicrobiaceae bacterium]|nr:NAD+ synthase [Acidimicrobiaceae bacterium]